MIKHIVMWRAKEGVTKENSLHQIKSDLEKLKLHIPEINELEVGFDILNAEVSSDMVLYSSFLTEEDLKTYQNHPEHLKVVKRISAVMQEKRVVDYHI